MRILITILLIYIGTGAFLYLFQNSFIYFPTPKFEHQFDEETFVFDDAVVNVLIANKGKPKAILYFGGNGEAVEYSAPELAKDLPDFAIYLVQYRGYGGSTGEPSEKGIYSDALYIFDKLKQDHSEIHVIGRSLGSGVATLVASKREVTKLVLITPFDSVESVAQKIYPIFPVSLLLKEKYNSIGRVESIKAKTLALIAEDDKVIKKIHSEKLANKFNQSQITKVVIANVGHNSISNNRQYNKALNDFFESNNN